MFTKYKITPSQLCIALVKFTPRLPLLLLSCLKISLLPYKNAANWTFAIRENARKYPDTIAVADESGTRLTWKEFNLVINRYCCFFIKSGIRKGEVVQIVLENRIELLLAVSALSKIGVVSALANPDIPKSMLDGLIATSNARYLITEKKFIEKIRPIAKGLHQCFIADSSGAAFTDSVFVPIDTYQVAMPDDEPPLVTTELQSASLLLPTSGTSGSSLKYAVITQKRVLLSQLWFGKAVLQLCRKDVIYSPLPMYHIFSLVVGWQASIICGASFTFRKKFSVSEFRNDLVKHNVTVLMYVGELLSILLTSDKENTRYSGSLKTIFGNGLRVDKWNDIKKKYSLRRVIEMYGMSESALVFTNLLNLPATIGFSLQPYAVVKYDDLDNPVLNKNGHLIKVRLHETGLLFSKADRRHAFDGYTDKNCTISKIINNAFDDGDTWVNTGDIVQSLGFGHLQYIRRISGSYRINGENILTSMVEDVFNQYPDVLYSFCYSIKLPDSDETAGMVSMVTKSTSTDIIALSDFVKCHLPQYSIPKYLRIMKTVAYTETFKVSKINLQYRSLERNTDEDLFRYDIKTQSYSALP